MKRFILAASVVLVCWLGLAAAPAVAQNTYPYMQPRFGPGWQTPLSPYLNLLIPGNTAVDYYGLVEPQFQQRQYNNMTNQTILGLINQFPAPPGIFEGGDIYAPLNATGHPIAINYTGTYFSNLTGQPYPGIGGLQQRRLGGGGGRPMGAGGMGGMGMGGMGGMGMGGMGGMGMGGMGGMGMGMGGGGGTWPNNARSGMGMPGR
ncbi:MAG: hypothetical protein ACYC3I_10160 [Gemmataceae bacterium]